MDRWFMQKNGKSVGPGSGEQLVKAFKKGVINRETLVANQESGPWIPFAKSGLIPQGDVNPFMDSDGDSGGGQVPVGSPLSDFFASRPKFGKSRTAAPFMERLIAVVIDIFVVGIGSSILLSLTWWIPYVSTAISLLTGIIYFVVVQHEWGWTVGRKVMKMHIERESGGKPDFQTLVIRYFAAMISGLILCLGYLMALNDPRVRTLHDRIAKTVVVKDPG